MGHNLLSGSLYLINESSIKVTGSFLGNYTGTGAGLTDIPYSSVYSIDNPGTGRIITTKNATGNSFEGHPNFTYNEANKALTVKGADNTTALTITGSQLNVPLRVITDPDPNLLYVDGDGIGKIGIGTNSPTVKLEVAGTVKATKFVIGSADISEVELEVLDGATTTTAELNILDGDTAATSTTLVDADRLIVNDAGVMKQVALTDFETYFEGALDTLSNVTSVGTLSSLAVTGDITADTTTFKVDSSNNRVGIGTALPLQTLSVSGTLAVSASTNPVYFHGLQPATLPNTSSYLGVDTTTGRLVLTSSAQGSGGSGGTIGAAEDGDYTDGLYTDFTTATTIGTAVDRFNEVLKILAPSPAPAIRFIDKDVTDGVAAKLSFGPAPHFIDTFANVGTAAGHSAVDSNGTYQESYTGEHKRLGVYDGTQIITGFVNANVDRNETNGYLAYASGSFNNGDAGTLKLEVNGSTLHSVSLSGLSGTGNPATGSANSLTGNSGFTNVSINASSFDGNGAEWNIFKHRTAKYKIHTADQRHGWNYARVIHTVGSTDHTTNYIEWVNDPSGSSNNLAAANPRIENITLAGSKYLSGVRYNTAVTANYKVDVQNMYQNVYPASGTPVSFTVTNSSTPAAQSVPDIESDNDRERILALTASLAVNVDNLLNSAVTAKVTATHPLKNTLTNAGTATTGDGFLMDNRTLSSTNLSEKFHDESYRKISSNAYDTQASVTSGTDWDSTAHMVATGTTGHTDGLIMFNQRLYSPKATQLPLSGDFSALSNVYGGQPDYSAASGTKTFYRKIQNTSGAAIRDMKISSTKTTSRVISHASTLGTQKIKIYAKIPADTGWMDISQNFVYGSVSDGNGALIDGASDNLNVASGQNSAVHCITFGTESVANTEYVMLRILADASWTGYVEQLNFQLGASDVSAPTQAPVLDDIVVGGTGVSDAKLSFGSSNAIADYTAVTGSGIGLSNFDSNVNYPASGDRLGVFNTKSNITGDLNEDVAANGDNYPADAFRDAYTGTLELHVNGRKVHEIDLTSTVNAITDDFNANSSGFSVSALDWSKTTDLVPSYTLPYRTGTFQIGANEQDLGWNTAKVIHNLGGGSTTTTNYIEWVVDTDANALDKSDIVLANFNHLDVYYQSGVRYFASQPSASYAYRATNVYRNVYQNGTAVSFPNTTNCFVNKIEIRGVGISDSNAAAATSTLPSLNNSSDCEIKDIHVTGTVVLDNSTSIKGGLGLFSDVDVTVTSQILHPQKSDLVTTAQSKADFMYYSGTIGSTTLTADEYFGLETYRVQNNAYANQAAVTNSSQEWNSQISVNDAGSYASYADGLVTANGYLISPTVIGNSGDTRNVADGGSLQAPPGSPNYSSLTNSTRTYYRYFRNTTGVAKATFTITLYGDANLVAKSGAFYTGSPGANKNINVEVKVPFDPSFTGDDDTSTAWGDCIKPYSGGTQPDSDGVGVFNGGGSDLNQTVGGSGRAIAIQLQEKQIRNNQYFVVKITAHEDWTGYLSRIGITY